MVDDGILCEVFSMGKCWAISDEHAMDVESVLLNIYLLSAKLNAEFCR